MDSRKASRQPAHKESKVPVRRVIEVRALKATEAHVHRLIEVRVQRGSKGNALQHLVQHHLPQIKVRQRAMRQWQVLHAQKVVHHVRGPTATEIATETVIATKVVAVANHVRNKQQ